MNGRRKIRILALLQFLMGYYYFWWCLMTHLDYSLNTLYKQVVMMET